jgi:hypothetical protein
VALATTHARMGAHTLARHVSVPTITAIPRRQLVRAVWPRRVRHMRRCLMNDDPEEVPELEPFDEEEIENNPALNPAPGDDE